MQEGASFRSKTIAAGPLLATECAEGVEGATPVLLETTEGPDDEQQFILEPRDHGGIICYHCTKTDYYGKYHIFSLHYDTLRQNITTSIIYCHCTKIH